MGYACLMVRIEARCISVGRSVHLPAGSVRVARALRSYPYSLPNTFACLAAALQVGLWPPRRFYVPHIRCEVCRRRTSGRVDLNP